MKKILNELLAAIDRKDKKAVKRMLKEHPYLFHAECPQQWPVIHRCVQDPVNASCLDVDLAKLFVSYGGDVNQKAGGGISLLFLAATNFESQAVAEYLVSCGARMSSFEQAVAALMREENKARARAKVLKLLDHDPHLIREADYDG